jgi:hypothetical protein
MQITATDHTLASGIGGDILVGRAFAFIGAAAFEKPALAWVGRLLGGGPPRARIVSLLGPEAVALPGATIAPASLPSLHLAAVTSDKALYREGRDQVHLLALDPLAPGAETVLEIELSGASYARRPLRLDARGAAAVTLRDLPAGDYAIRLRGQPKDSPACAFTVAAYRLAPLVASLSDRRLEGQRLAVTLLLTSFGSPVNGAVELELTERGARLSRKRAEAKAGVVEASFELTGEGPHAINVQLVADPARTATVPIVGSRAAERSLTTFSTLGYEVKGSLLPGEGAVAVRGVFLQEGAIRTTPFRLERVDTTRARITAVVPVASARIVVVDPAFPAPRPGAVDPATAPHPVSDTRYQVGETLFRAGSHAEARGCFEDALATLDVPHPNYAYYVACCLAHEGDLAGAVAALERSIRDGWKNFELLRADDDLAALHGYPPYEALKEGGRREILVEDVAAGRTLEVEVPGPMGIVVIGAYVDGAAWEGWAATIAPAVLAPQVSVPERAAPGDMARIEVDSGRSGDDVSVYLVVKDARLLTPDTPASRLAGGLKAVAEATSNELTVGKPARTLAQALPPRQPPSPPPWRGAPMMFSDVSAAEEMVYPALPGGGPPPPPMGFGPPPGMAFGASQSGGIGSADAMNMALGAPRPAAAAPGAAMPSQRAKSVGSPKSAAPAPAPAGPYREAAPPPPPAVEEPEVLFAGLVETKGGKGAVSLRLGPDFADYVVDVFAVAGLDWAPAEARFRAEAEVFASLEVPAFVHPDDAAVARLHVGSRAGARVRVTRDGADVKLILGGRALAPGDRVEAGRAELSFLAGPGRYEATVEDGSGATARAAKDVEEPGKLRRLARTVRMLEPGQSLSRDEDATIVGLRILPGLDGPFTALVDATADYGHACCEQTAAKMLSACAMYALSQDDRTRRDRAEAIILAGVKREASMFLRGRGFKMYPEISPEPNAYGGPVAARHLHNLVLLRDLSPGRALAGAVDEGLDMAADATHAYGLAWPPRVLASAADAYAALRFGEANGEAVAFVKLRTAGDAPPPSPYAPGNVGLRAEAAYAAAVLLRAGGTASLPRALALANLVVKALGSNGRLYSTVDSVAAIALMVELVAAKVVGGAGKVEIDGTVMSTVEAVEKGSPRAVRAVEGVAAVEVTRRVEEDWGAFSAALPITVKLTKGDRVTRRLDALDAVSLEVAIDGGYKAGDLLWVCLPDALSRVVGGGQVKRFSVDFAGADKVTVPLAATGVTVGPRGEAGAATRFAVCVRNMFEEERGGNPGPIEIMVAPPAGGGVLDRMLVGLRGLFGA